MEAIANVCLHRIHECRVGAASSGMLKRMILLMCKEWQGVVGPDPLAIVCSSNSSFLSVWQVRASDVCATPAETFWPSSRWLDLPKNFARCRPHLPPHHLEWTTRALELHHLRQM